MALPARARGGRGLGERSEAGGVDRRAHGRYVRRVPSWPSSLRPNGNGADRASSVATTEAGLRCARDEARACWTRNRTVFRAAYTGAWRTRKRCRLVGRAAHVSRLPLFSSLAPVTLKRERWRRRRGGRLDVVGDAADESAPPVNAGPLWESCDPTTPASCPAGLECLAQHTSPVDAYGTCVFSCAGSGGPSCAPAAGVRLPAGRQRHARELFGRKRGGGRHRVCSRDGRWSDRHEPAHGGRGGRRLGPRGRRPRRGVRGGGHPVRARPTS